MCRRPPPADPKYASGKKRNAADGDCSEQKGQSEDDGRQQESERSDEKHGANKRIPDVQAEDSDMDGPGPLRCAAILADPVR